MFCANCGNNVKKDARFCGKCGTPVGKGQSQAPVQVASQVSQTVNSQPPPSPKPPNGPQQSSLQAPSTDSQQIPPTMTPIGQQLTPQGQQIPPQAPSQIPQQVLSHVPPQGPPHTSGEQQYQNGSLSFRIFGENLPAVSIRLNSGEGIYTQSGGMTWMDTGITMTTNMKGGLMKGLGRMISGESLFMATYTSNAPNQEIVIASSFPGSISAVNLTGGSIIAQKSAFLCAQPSVTLSAYVNKSLKAGFFGGEGFVMQRLSGYGYVFIEIDGSLVERTLAPGETIKVDTGNVAAFEESVDFRAEMVKGFKNILFGGEGLFLTTLTGPGKVWLQTMTLSGFAKQLIPFLPKPSSN